MNAMPSSCLQPRINTQVPSFVFVIVDTSITLQGVQPSRIQAIATFLLDDGSNTSQNVSWETKDANNLALLPPQHWKHCTHFYRGIH